MKKITAAILSAAMAVSMMAAAAAETTVNATKYDFYDADLNINTNTVAVRETSKSPYVLYDANGNALTSLNYNRMSANYGNFTVSVESGINVLGVIDGQGNELVPMQYGDIDYISNDWIMAQKVVESDAENYDIKYYGNGENTYCLVDTVDMYYRGQLVATVGRMDYKYGSAYGAYVRVTTREDKYVYYGWDGTVTDGEGKYGEFDYAYKTKTVTHNPTGKVAFAAESTLTTDEVKQPLYEKDGIIYDMQGNVRYEDTFNYISFYDGSEYARAKTKTGFYGMVDGYGNLVIPCEYDDINYTLTLPSTGYQYVVKDGKAGFVNANGEVTCDFIYSKDIVNKDSEGIFLYVKDLTGAYIVLTAASGELPQRYADLSIYNSNGSPMLPVELTEGNAGVIGLAGEEIVPFDGTYDDYYDLKVSRDGSLIVGYAGYGNGYYFYNVNYELPGVAEVEVDENAWTCVNCGTENSGNFCVECGSPKPVVEEVVTWTCPNDGAENTGKFCEECGKEKPWECPSCGKANTGKFCPNDGTAKPVE